MPSVHNVAKCGIINANNRLPNGREHLEGSRLSGTLVLSSVVETYPILGGGQSRRK